MLLQHHGRRTQIVSVMAFRAIRGKKEKNTNSFKIENSPFCHTFWTAWPPLSFTEGEKKQPHILDVYCGQGLQQEKKKKKKMSLSCSFGDPLGLPLLAMVPPEVPSCGRH